MNTSNIIKSLLIGSILGFSTSSIASSVPSTQIFSLAVDGAAQNIGGIFGIAPDDLWGFDLSSPGHTTSSTANFAFSTSPTGMTVELYSDVNGDYILDAGDSLIASDTGTLVNLIAYLGGTPAKYILKFSGVSFEGYLGTVSAVSTVPLPGAALLFATALLGAGAVRRKKQKQAGMPGMAAA